MNRAASGPRALGRRAFAEALGTAFLVAGIVGSGIMADRLTDDDGLTLLANAIATGGVLVAVILTVGPVSGAHLNPVVTIADRAFGGVESVTAVVYVAAQVGGALVGCVVANVMFDLPAIEWSTTSRSGADLWLGEIVATLGLLLVVFGVVRSGRATAAPFAVAGYIVGAYFFTSSTSFANPAVTVGRALTDTFTGIEPVSVPGFVVAQLVGLLAALVCVRVLFPRIETVADEVVVPHDEQRTLPADGGGS